MDEQKGEVVGKINSVKADDFKRCHAVGVYGGVNPFGELVFELHEDVVDIPDEFELIRIPDEVQFQEQRINDSGLSITRIRHAEITIPMQAVPSIVSWLQDKVNEHNRIVAESIDAVKG